MQEYLEKALGKLAAAKAPNGAKETAIFTPMVKTLTDFCRQNSEFAQAVVQGGSVADCAAEVAKGVKRVGNVGIISDLDAYRRAARFYFPGCEVEMTMKIYMSEYDKPAPAEESEGAPKAPAIALDLADFW